MSSSIWDGWWGSQDAKQQTRQLHRERDQLTRLQNAEIGQLKLQAEAEKRQEEEAVRRGNPNVAYIHINKRLATESRMAAIAENHEKGLEKMDNIIQQFQERQSVGTIARASNIIQETDDAHLDDKEVIETVERQRDEDAAEAFERDRERIHTLAYTAPVASKVHHRADNKDAKRIFLEAKMAQRKKVEAENAMKMKMLQQQVQRE